MTIKDLFLKENNYIVEVEINESYHLFIEGLTEYGEMIDGNFDIDKIENLLVEIIGEDVVGNLFGITLADTVESVMAKAKEKIKEKTNNLRVCRHCLMAIESREGRQITRTIEVDSENEEESKCEWCEDNGFDTLYEFI
jgi:hypothetical protein